MQRSGGQSPIGLTRRFLRPDRKTFIAFAATAPIFETMGYRMNRGLVFVFVALMAVSATAQEVSDPTVAGVIQPAGDSDLSEFLWIKRPVVVFADSPADPRYAEQIERLSESLDMLIERDVVILTDTDPAASSPLRQKLRPRGFMLVLVGKDGGVKLRKPHPWTVREITRSIDKTPERQREIDQKRGF
jgi:hypothetical protein